MIRAASKSLNTQSVRHLNDLTLCQLKNRKNKKKENLRKGPRGTLKGSEERDLWEGKRISSWMDGASGCKKFN